MKYMCAMCGWIYDEEIGDPENGIAPGTKFQYLPDQYDCQFCYADKSCFYPRSEDAPFLPSHKQNRAII
mgnify:CR=1 FL=1